MIGASSGPRLLDQALSLPFALQRTDYTRALGVSSFVIVVVVAGGWWHVKVPLAVVRFEPQVGDQPVVRKRRLDVLQAGEDKLARSWHEAVVLFKVCEKDTSI